MEPLHTPEEMRTLSNVGHWIEGGIIAIVGFLALLEATQYLPSDSSTFAWPAFVLLAGLALPAYMLLHHGLDRVRASWRFVMGDSQQRQHFFMAVLLLVAGLAEMSQRMRGGGAVSFDLVWPMALGAIGGLFLVHTQHGSHEAVSWAMRVHRYLGLVLIAAGLARLGQLVWLSMAPWLAFVWPVLLLLAAILLVSYREPAGAYEEEAPRSHGPHHSG